MTTLTTNFRTLVASAALLALPLAACQDKGFDDADSIAEEIQLEQGGIDMQDEAPMFGESDLFAEARFEDESEVRDLVAEDEAREETEDESCARGFLRGRWHKVAPHRGRLLGQVRDSDGETIGRMRGVYGQRRNGNKVFFGKYITEEGGFRGLFAGRYQEGHFRGVWLNREGEVGALGGAYRDIPRDGRIGGHYLGRWASSSCIIDVRPPVDMPDRPDPSE